MPLVERTVTVATVLLRVFQWTVLSLKERVLETPDWLERQERLGTLSFSFLFICSKSCPLRLSPPWKFGWLVLRFYAKRMADLFSLFIAHYAFEWPDVFSANVIKSPFWINSDAFFCLNEYDAISLSLFMWPICIFCFFFLRRNKSRWRTLCALTK